MQFNFLFRCSSFFRVVAFIYTAFNKKAVISGPNKRHFCMYVIEICIYVYVTWQHNVAWNLCEFSSVKTHFRFLGERYHF